MILISIAGDEHSLQDASPDWITQQIERRRRDGLPVCVTVTIKDSGLDLRLTTPECGGGRGGGGRGGGGRAPTPSEAEVFELWARLHLNQPGWSPGNVIAFLRQIRR